MSIKIITEEIDGKRYTVSQLPPKQALKLGLKVLKVAGVFASAFKDLDTSKGISDSQGLDTLGKLFKDVDPDEVVGLIEELVRCAFRETEQVSGLDRDFAGEDGPELVTALKVAWLVLRVNFGGLLSKLGNSKALPKA